MVEETVNNGLTAIVTDGRNVLVENAAVAGKVPVAKMAQRHNFQDATILFLTVN